MTRPMTDGEACDLIEATNTALADITDRVEALEKQVAALVEKNDDDIRRLWNHISMMPGGV